LLGLTGRPGRHDPTISYRRGRACEGYGLSCRNGTYLNGEMVEKTTLSSGDIVWVGDVALRFLQDNHQEAVDVGSETQELTHPGVSRGLAGGELQTSGLVKVFVY
jgi:pSer/pThr/pTyr-binding forkhead associated (FHA) protein